MLAAREPGPEAVQAQLPAEAALALVSVQAAESEPGLNASPEAASPAAVRTRGSDSSAVRLPAAVPEGLLLPSEAAVSAAAARGREQLTALPEAASPAAARTLG